MAFKLGVGVILLNLLISSYAFPASKDDMSIYFHTDTSARIVGGTPAGSTPYMVALTSGLMFRSLVCGASLVSVRHVLTAAHCIDSLYNYGLSRNLRGIVGTTNYYSGGTPIEFTHNITHPLFDRSVAKNDIGILVAISNIGLSSNVKLINLGYDFVGAGVPTTVTGWGRTSEGGHISTNLLRLNAQVVDGDFCVSEVARRAIELERNNIPHVDPELELCTFHSAGHGTCNGDSGSALLRTDRNEQIGIVSWGIACAHAAPDVFVRISTYRSWLQQHLRLDIDFIIDKR